jgi:hypothetical protein
MAVFRIVRTVNAIAIERAGLQTGHVTVPNLMCELGQLQSGDFIFSAWIIKTQLHAFCMGRKQREVYAFAIKVRPKLQARSRRNFKTMI